MPASDLVTYFDILNRWKRFILAVVGGTAIVAVVVSFLLPKWYAARSTFIPPRESDIQASLSSLMAGLAIPGLGGALPASGESQLFLAILDSRTLREKLIRDFDLMPVYKAKNMDQALKVHHTLARAGLTDQGVVEVVVEDRDPKRAAAMANAWVAALDDFNKNARMTGGKRSRLFVERRLGETRNALVAAEKELADYQMNNRNAPLAPDVSAAIDAGASLLARRMAAEVHLTMMAETYRESAPQVEQARSELSAIDRQIGTLPPLAMEYARLLRNMKVQEQVYALLVAQYEEAKIREDKDVPTLDILDTAVPPHRRVRPIRWLFCASLTMAALVLALATAFSVEFVRRIRAADPGAGTFRDPARSD